MASQAVEAVRDQFREHEVRNVRGIPREAAASRPTSTCGSRDPDIGWPLDELWVGSELLDGPAEIEATPLVVVLDASPEDLPWLALHPAGDWICEQLGLTKRPISSDRGGARGWVFLVS